MMPSVEYRNQVAESLKAIWKRDPTPAEVDTELLAQKHILDREKQVPDIIPGGAERRASGQIAERLLPPAAVQRRVRSDKGSAPLKADLERMPPEMRAAARAAIRVGGSVGSTLGNVISPITAPEDAWFWLLDKAGYKQEYLGPLQNLVHGLKGASETLTATAEEDRQNQGDTGQASTLNDVIEGGLTAYGDINTRFKAIHKLLEAGGVVATPAKVMALAGGVDNMDKGTLATLQGVVDGAIRGKALDAAISKLGVIKGSLATGVGSGVETYATTGDPKKALESAAVMTGLGLGGGGVKEDLNSMRPVGRDVARAESLPVGEMLNASEGIRAGQERAANESARRGLSSIGDQMKAKGQAPLEGQNAEATRPVEQSLGADATPNTPETATEAETPHYSNFQPRYQRGAKRGQFKEGSPEIPDSGTDQGIEGVGVGASPPPLAGEADLSSPTGTVAPRMETPRGADSGMARGGTVSPADGDIRLEENAGRPATPSEGIGSVPPRIEQPAEGGADFRAGDVVKIAGAEREIVGKNSDGTYAVRNENGDVWDESPTSVWEKVPPKASKGPDESYKLRRDDFIELNQREKLGTARAKLTEVRARIPETLRSQGIKLPVGISPEQYLDVHVGERARPNKLLKTLKRELDSAQSGVVAAERELANRKELVGTTRYTESQVHRKLVESALRQGKPVPPEVLADYPDLAEKYSTPAPSPSAQTQGEVNARPSDERINAAPPDANRSEGSRVGTVVPVGESGNALESSPTGPKVAVTRAEREARGLNPVESKPIRRWVQAMKPGKIRSSAAR
jgi:hypothetical protein